MVMVGDEAMCLQCAIENSREPFFFLELSLIKRGFSGRL
ncbi:unnamed protein product [Tuber melanosporum]|uniref:(Perigord truffle) hypothetical protein n=1 Tax=Tuber melanosporum (strain Mel28) TaxID=656061 RepID=D5GIS9_TUBMM|nr:uncharacterized protein GSTUM_00008659001 [Tuber melanosporum]CAZ84422.1 unnamed protein product [Tuber melanosporum]